MDTDLLAGLLADTPALSWPRLIGHMAVILPVLARPDALPRLAAIVAVVASGRGEGGGQRCRPALTRGRGPNCAGYAMRGPLRETAAETGVSVTTVWRTLRESTADVPKPAEPPR